MHTMGIERITQFAPKDRGFLRALYWAMRTNLTDDLKGKVDDPREHSGKIVDGHVVGTLCAAIGVALAIYATTR